MKSQLPIYILPGWTYQLDKWQNLTASLTDNGLEVKILPIPGLTGEKLSQAWTLNDYVEWLRTQLPDQPLVLLGHSNGGRIALAYLAKYQTQTAVQKLILIDSAGLIDQRLKMRLKRQVFAAAAKTGKKILGHSRFGEKLLYKLAREQDYHQATPVMKAIMQNLINADLAPAAAQVNLLTLLIWGARDTYTPLFQGRELATLIPDSRLKIISDARHSPHFTHTAAVVDEILDFLAINRQN